VVEASGELIEHVPLFAGLNESELRTVARSLKEHTFAAGTSVTRQGEEGVGFFVIESGAATVSVGGSEVAHLGPGDWFGDVALIAASARTATITADADVHCFGIVAWDFRPLLQDHPSIAWKLLQTLARRLSEAEQRQAS
jgi:CRP/FNR family cyclic AMP-dependent transcriptional regulator